MAANKNKVSKERVTLLFCSYMDGSEKLKPIFIVNAENPRCFNHKRIKKQNLPVHYYSNKSKKLHDAFEDVTSRAKKQTTITDFFPK